MYIHYSYLLITTCSVANCWSLPEGIHHDLVNPDLRIPAIWRSIHNSGKVFSTFWIQQRLWLVTQWVCLSLKVAEITNKFWLVVYQPLWKIWKSIGIIIISNIWKHEKMVQTTRQNCTSNSFKVEIFWLVVEPSLWKIWLRQLGWWHPQLNGTIKDKFQSPPISFVCFRLASVFS